MVTDKKIGVLMGGRSAEREVSLRSGNAVHTALKNLAYDAIAIDTDAEICEALRREKVKIAFLALHGGDGEIGAVQGMLEVLGIPYTGSGVLASALAMDKEASKMVFLYHKIPVTRSAGLALYLLDLITVFLHEKFRKAGRHEISHLD